MTARDGRELVLRSIGVDDIAALQRGFVRLSPEDVRMRFLHPMNELPYELAAQLCDLDPRNAAAWVLADPDGTPAAEIHAVARVHLDPVTEHAEFAVVVQRELSGQGFGRLLLERAIGSARGMGATEIWGDVLVENTAMLGLCDRLGFRHGALAHQPGILRVTLAV